MEEKEKSLIPEKRHRARVLIALGGIVSVFLIGVMLVSTWFGIDFWMVLRHINTILFLAWIVLLLFRWGNHS